MGKKGSESFKMLDKLTVPLVFADPEKKKSSFDSNFICQSVSDHPEQRTK